MLDLTYIPSSNFGRYALQNEYSMENFNEMNEGAQQKTTPNNIPPLMSLSITPPGVATTNTQQKSTTPTSVIKENVEPLPFPSHSPGPIQRPTKLPCPTIEHSAFVFTESTQSPSTPDVLVQINHLLDHQNSITTAPSTSNTASSTTTTTSVHDLPTPNVPWTPFLPTDWPPKYDSSWPMANMQSPNISLTAPMQNPFAQQRAPKEESTVWPTALGTATPRSTPLVTRPERSTGWNELFPNVTPSSAESTKATNSSWPKFLPVSDSPSSGNLTPNKPDNEVNNNPFWNPMTPASNTTAAWWPKPSTDENQDDKDRSRWDFAR